jgi:hypothetical protein
MINSAEARLRLTIWSVAKALTVDINMRMSSFYRFILIINVSISNILCVIFICVFVGNFGFRVLRSGSAAGPFAAEELATVKGGLEEIRNAIRRLETAETARALARGAPEITEAATPEQEGRSTPRDADATFAAIVEQTVGDWFRNSYERSIELARVCKDRPEVIRRLLTGGGGRIVQWKAYVDHPVLSPPNLNVRLNLKSSKADEKTLVTLDKIPGDFFQIGQLVDVAGEFYAYDPGSGFSVVKSKVRAIEKISTSLVDEQAK